jgi:hypothetical protein
VTSDGVLEPPPRDVLGPRPVPVVWYAPVLVAYIGLGLLLKSVVLNGIVGPLFPLLVLYVVPRIGGRVVARRRSRR